jgi:hypothetical protein
MNKWNWLRFIGSKASDGHGAYILYEDRTDDKIWTANSILSSQLADHIADAAVTTENWILIFCKRGAVVQYYKDYDNFQAGSRQEADLNIESVRL